MQGVARVLILHQCFGASLLRCFVRCFIRCFVHRFDQELKSDAVNGEVCTVGRTWRAKIRRQAARFAGDPEAKLTESH
jgi:hypothetical protein